MNYTEGYVRKNHVTSEKGVSMDRVIIPGEAPGSATYYMGFAPEEYGTRLYEMEYYGDAVIREALMDIGSQRTKPYQTISSSKEYENLVWKSKGRTIYSCRFEVTYKDIYITVEPDFETKRLTLKVDPAINQTQKSQLAEFFEILTELDYYEVKELEEIEDELHDSTENHKHITICFCAFHGSILDMDRSQKAAIETTAGTKKKP